MKNYNYKMIKTKNLEQIFFSKKKLTNQTKIIPVSEESRDETYFWKKPTTKSYKYLLEFPEIILLSRIYFIKPKPIRFSLEISIDEKGETILIANKVQCTENAMKVINIGFLPCKFITITTFNSQPFPESSNIKCYGLRSDYIHKKHGKESVQLLYDNPKEIIYK